MSFGAVSTSLPHIRAGRLRALGVTSLKRLAAVPEVPAFAEAGLPGFEVVQWFGVFAPAGVPPAIVRKVNAALGRALSSVGLKEHLFLSIPARAAGYSAGEISSRILPLEIET